VGGLIGYDTAGRKGWISSAYWDTTTSGQKKGAGNKKNDPGITGLTTEQLQSELPAGFDPTIWAEAPNINGGLPYQIVGKTNSTMGGYIIWANAGLRLQAIA
jgi:hypothetical protein